jgi:choline dehydrogenase-like flavoprotein
MSAAFREQARRAVDAISRIPFMPTLQSESEAVSLETRKLDAEKATDEAKYKVATAKDREVLKMLDAYLLARTALSSRSTRDLDAYAKMDRQCAIELAVTFNTGELREDIKREAENKTCLTQLAQQDAVTKERLRKMGVPSP